MKAIGTPGSVIDQILGHTKPNREANVPSALAHYVVATRILEGAPDPEKVALDNLAAALAMIETSSGGKRALTVQGERDESQQKLDNPPQ